MFSIYLGPFDDAEVVDYGSLLLRLSTENAAEYSLWIDMLEQACAIKELGKQETPLEARTNGEEGVSPDEPATPSDQLEDEWGHSPLEVVDRDVRMIENEGDSLNPAVMKRVKSSNLILRKSMSRQTMTRKILAGRAPSIYSKSGHRLSLLPGKVEPVVEERKRGLAEFPAYKPMHVESASSPLSTDARSGQYNFRGFFNLGVIILILSHFDLMVNNMSKHGLQVSIQSVFSALPCDAEACAVPSSTLWLHLFMGMSRRVLLVLLSWSASILSAFAVEKMASRGALSSSAALLSNCLLGTVNLLLPSCWVWLTSGSSHPVLNMLYLFQSVIIWLKLISYAHANKDLRRLHGRQRKSGGVDRSGFSSCDELAVDAQDRYREKSTSFNDKLHSIFSEVKDIQPPFLMYPQNLSLQNLSYFMVAPTLCYQLNYPRSSHVRYRYALWTVVRMIFVGM